VVEGRVKLVRSVAPTASDDHHDLCLEFAESRHALMNILA
jgi:hypothetical protein